MEIVDIIDQNGNLTGEIMPRRDVHRFGLLHHASGLIILRKMKRGGEIPDTCSTAFFY